MLSQHCHFSKYPFALNYFPNSFQVLLPICSQILSVAHFPSNIKLSDDVLFTRVHSLPPSPAILFLNNPAHSLLEFPHQNLHSFLCLKLSVTYCSLNPGDLSLSSPLAASDTMPFSSLCTLHPEVTS